MLYARSPVRRPDCYPRSTKPCSKRTCWRWEINGCIELSRRKSKEPLAGCDLYAEFEPMQRPFFTIGHSTRPFVEFVDLLRASEVAFIVDVRTTPMSRRNPQYNLDTFPSTLS